mmetsp:Transcript_67592/g.170575  ORF Transcript_67592/g.170575 Transcript_67592/m.170575 type:complete len:97 (+) Transcript_67592:3920-4210(+)
MRTTLLSRTVEKIPGRRGLRTRILFPTMAPATLPPPPANLELQGKGGCGLPDGATGEHPAATVLSKYGRLCDRRQEGVAVKAVYQYPEIRSQAACS